MCVYLLEVNIYTPKKNQNYFWGLCMVIWNGGKCLFTWKVSSILFSLNKYKIKAIFLEKYLWWKKDHHKKKLIIKSRYAYTHS